MAARHILLLTGVPGIGKTTVLRRVAERLAPRPLGGFYTAELRAAGERLGFQLCTFAGEERVIAHVDFPGPARVSHYGVDVAAIDAVVEAALAFDTARDVYLVDEIGKMECLSGRFVTAMRRLLDSPALVVATVAARGTGLIAEARARADAELWEVRRDNRDRLPEEVLRWLKVTGFERDQ